MKTLAVFLVAFAIAVTVALAVTATVMVSNILALPREVGAAVVAVILVTLTAEVVLFGSYYIKECDAYYAARYALLVPRVIFVTPFAVIAYAGLGLLKAARKVIW